MNLDLKAGLAAALLADCSYQEDAALCVSEFAALGHKVVARMSDDMKQAVITADPKDGGGVFNLNTSGSRIAGDKSVGGSYGAMLGDVMQDMDVTPFATPGGYAVTAGPWRRAQAIFSWAKAQVPAGSKWRFRGHSLGSWCNLYAFSSFALDEVLDINVLASPKGAEAAYWASLPPGALEKVTSWIYRRDLWAGYPWRLPGAPAYRHLPGASIAWLDGKNPPRAISETDWPGGINPSDHDLDCDEGATRGYVAGSGGFRDLLAKAAA